MRYIYQNQLDKTWLQQDMAYGDFKYWNRRIFAEKVLIYKAFNIAKDKKYDGYQPGLVLMVYNFLIKNFW